MITFGGRAPEIDPSVFLAPTAVIIGNVTIGAESSVWPGAVIRGDDPDHPVVIGRSTSVQENCVIHVGHWGPTVVGDDVTIGHGAKFECCRIGDRSVVGMNAVILQRRGHRRGVRDRREFRRVWPAPRSRPAASWPVSPGA